MKKSKLTRTLLAACSIVALTAVLSGCLHSSDDPAPVADGGDGDGDGDGDDMDDDDMEPTPEEIAAATAQANSKRMAIAAEAAQTTDAGLGGTATTATGNAEGAYNVVIEYGSTGIRVEGATDDADEMFMMNDMGMLVREMDPDDDGNIVREIAMVATNIEAPVDTAFAMVTGQGLNARDLDPATDADMDGTDDNDFTALTVVAGTDNVNLPLIMSSAFASSTAAVLTFSDDDATTTSVDEADEVRGTYNGASGTYRCNGTADCTVTIDGMGDISAISGDWVFTPDAGATSPVPDAEYLHYGFWLQQTEDSDGVITYDEVETFAGSSLDATANVSTVTGTATYAGGAVGVYVRDVHSSGGGMIESSTSGHFSADVMLTANFAQTVDDTTTTGVNEAGQLPPSMLNTITGSISNFVLSGGEESDWGVNLMGSITDSDASFSGSANGGGAAGTFAGQFHGPTPETASTGDGTTAVAPVHAIGEFNANFSNGTVAGAFGAERE